LNHFLRLATNSIEIQTASPKTLRQRNEQIRDGMRRLGFTRALNCPADHCFSLSPALPCHIKFIPAQ
jgi:hypothetical protein